MKKLLSIFFLLLSSSELFPVIDQLSSKQQNKLECAICLLNQAESPQPITAVQHEIELKNACHTFHEICLRTWLHTSQDILCPICKQEIAQKTITYLTRKTSTELIFHYFLKCYKHMQYTLANLVGTDPEDIQTLFEE